MTGRLLRRGIAGLISLLVGLWFFELIQPLVANSLGGPQGLDPFLRALPPGIQALMKTQPEFIMLSGLAGYLSIGFNHPLYYVMVASALVGFICRSLAGEMDRGTIQIALARPISRARVYAARVAGAIVIMLALAAVGPLGLVSGMALAHPAGTLDYGNFLPTMAAGLLLFWAIAGLTLLGAAASDTTGRAVAWATGWLIIFYFIEYFATLWSQLKPIAPFSIFYYYDPAQALVNGAVPVTNVVVLLLVGAVGAVAGLVIFQRRDLPT
jgi:ABC-type transport system involved in multi-copper enzyme maturation permease subunit